MVGETGPTSIEQAALTDSKFAEGEIAYRRRQARGSLSGRERVVLGLLGAFVLFVIGNNLWAWLT